DFEHVRIGIETQGKSFLAGSKCHRHRSIADVGAYINCQASFGDELSEEIDFRLCDLLGWNQRVLPVGKLYGSIFRKFKSIYLVRVFIEFAPGFFPGERFSEIFQEHWIWVLMNNYTKQ